MTLNLKSTTAALVIVDLQLGILEPEPLPFGRNDVVFRAAALEHAFMEAKAPLVLTLTDFSPGYADAPKGAADSPWALPKDGLPADFATLVPEIDALPVAVRITKRQMSTFSAPSLICNSAAADATPSSSAESRRISASRRPLGPRSTSITTS